MTVLDDKLVPAVLALINKFGITGVFDTGSGEGVYTATTGDVAETASTVTRKVSPPVPFNQRLVDGATVRRDDTQVFVAGSGITFTPSIGMTIVIAGDKWKIVSVIVLRSGEQVAAYELQLRR